MDQEKTTDWPDAPIRSACEAATPKRRIIVTVDGARLDSDPQETFDDLGVFSRALWDGDTPRALAATGPWLAWPDLTPPPPLYAPDDGAAAVEDPDGMAERLAEAMRDALDADDPSGGGLLPPDPDTAPKRSFDAAVDVLAKLVHATATAAPVVWAFPDDLPTADVIRHFKRIGRLRLIRDGSATPGGRAAQGKAFEEDVALRQADGDVHAQIAPLLHPEQIDRLLGPAIEIVAVAPGPYLDGGNHLRILAGTDERTKAKGHLTLDRTQVRALENVRAGPLVRAIADELRAADGRAYEMGDAELVSEVASLRRQVVAKTPMRADRHVADLVGVMWHHGTGILDRADIAALLARPDWSRERKCVAVVARLGTSSPKVGGQADVENMILEER